MSYTRTRPFRSFRGLGDAMSDYVADHAAWVQEKAAYDKAAMGYSMTLAGQAAGYSSALASWNAQSAAHVAAVVAQQQQQIIRSRALDQANTAARAAGAVTPAGYPGCVTQAQHDAWVSTCSFMSQTVKGLGADPTGSPCALALLPVCPPPFPAPPPVGLKPAAPAPPAPPPPLRPEPQPPVATSVPVPVSTPPVLNTGPQAIPSTPVLVTTPPPPPPTKSGGLLSNGLILVVAAVGGYALYRTFKKPKAAA